ncbi:MAG: LON peptidase substrate-binding domain-containing protein [Bradyrhizobium sp.]|nr:LON peptidase substrate-binding domain-containing protein [Bradyrhizobium sp.]
MRDFRDAKAMAQTLRDTLKTKSISLSHSESLELVAKTLGFHDWNVLSAAIQATETVPAAKPPSLGGTSLPITPMRDVVFFPQVMTSIFVGRDKTKRAIESAIAGDGRLFVVAQKRQQDDDPDFTALYSIGVTADIIQRVELPNRNWRVKVSCSTRAAIVRPHAGDFLAADIEPIEETRGADPEAFARMREVLDVYPTYANAAVPPHLHGYSQEPGVLADMVASQLRVGIEKKQQALETSDVVTRLETVLALMKAGLPSP